MRSFNAGNSLLPTNLTGLVRAGFLTLAFAGLCSADSFSYFSGLGRFRNEDIPLYLLVAGTALFSFIIVLVKPTTGIILAMLIFPFVTQDAQMTFQKMLASVVLLGFFNAWLAGKIALHSTVKSEKDYNGCEKALLLFFGYLVINAGYGVMVGISPVDIVRDLIPISSLLIFLIIKRFVNTAGSTALLEKFQFALMILFALEFTVLTVTRIFFLYTYLPVSMSALQILGLFFVSMVGLISFNRSRAWLLLTGAIPAVYLVTTDNRTQFFAGIVGVGFAMLVTRTTRAKVVFTVAIALLLCSAFLFTQRYRPEAFAYKIAKLQRIGDARSDLAIDDRFGEARQCYDLFLTNPLLGSGAGYTYHMFRKYAHGHAPNGYLVTNFTHSDIMFLLSKLGLIGTLLLSWFYFKISKLAWQVWKKAALPNIRARGLICFIILLSALIVGQSTPVLQTRIDAFFLSLVVGYTYCLFRFYVAQPAPEPVLEGIDESWMRPMTGAGQEGFAEL